MTDPVPVRPDPIRGWRCHTCTRVSVDPSDIADEYCGHCHARTRGDLVVANWTDPWDDGNPPVLRLPRIGCSVHAHTALGWCGGCPRIGLSTEALGWRYHASQAMIPGYRGAVAMTADFGDRRPAVRARSPR